MELTHEFRVGVSVPDAWKVLTDVERIAPMLPGAQLQEVEGEEYRGIVKVKVGPITAQYKGKATFVEQDQTAGKVVLNASGRDTRGQGNASALITATMVPDGDGTKVSVVTDLTVTGKVAQFGRGVLAEVSSKLLGQFVDALEADLTSSGAEGGSGESPFEAGNGSGSGEAPADAAGAEAAGADAAGAVAGGAEAAPADEVAASSAAAPSASSDSSEPSTVRRISGPEAEPVDLLAVAGGSTMKRLLPVVGVVVVLIVVLGRRRARRASR
jgi:carbon monoxide dehydrogenase subunit G